MSLRICGFSLTQPWATLVRLGEKKVETRSWSTHYRGWVAIHAAKTFPVWAQETCRDVYFREYVSNPRALPRGAILALARLVSVQRTLELVPHLSAQEQAFGDYSVGRYGWVFGEVICLEEPLPYKGALGLWGLPNETKTHLLHRLSSANVGVLRALR